MQTSAIALRKIEGANLAWYFAIRPSSETWLVETGFPKERVMDREFDNWSTEFEGKLKKKLRPNRVPEQNASYMFHD